MKPIYAKPKKIPTIPLSHPVEASTTATNHPTGDAFFKNQIATVSPQYDADVKTGRALALGATNDLAIPIHNNGGANSFLTYHDIANDEIIQIGNAVDGGSSKELVVNGTFDSGVDGWVGKFGSLATPSWNPTGKISSAHTATASIGTQDAPFMAGRTYEITLTPTHYNGNTTANINFGLSTSNSSVNAGVATGSISFTDDVPITISGVCTADNAFLNIFRYDGDFVYFDNISVKEILPTSTEYILNDVTVNNILTHKMPFSAGDLTLIQQEPNLLAALAMGEATPISSVTLDADDSWYACSEVSGADVFDARVVGNDTTITGDLTNVRATNNQKGLQTTALLLDANGVPESYNSTPNTARVYDDTIISTGFKPSIARYSIEESVSGNLADLDANGDPLGTFSQRTEKRLLTHTDAKLGDDEGCDFELGTICGLSQNAVNVSFSAGNALLDATAQFGFIRFTSDDTKKYIATIEVDSASNTEWYLTYAGGASLNTLLTTGVNRVEVPIGSTNISIQNRSTTLVEILDIQYFTIKEISTENKYYIGTDGGAMVEQTTVPPLPDPNTTINLGDVAVIGYPDTIESREADFNVHSEAIVP